jgi:hypothetical protein
VEGVAASDYDHLGGGQGGKRIGLDVDRLDRDIRLREHRAHLRRKRLPCHGDGGEWHEQRPPAPRRDGGDLGHGMDEIAAVGTAGIAEQEEVHHDDFEAEALRK